MAAKKGGLGKGLDALFAENTVESDGAVTTLRLAEIVPNRDQPRKQFDEEALAELSESIAQHGVLQPLLVRPMTDGSYQLVAGERRWRASRMAGLTEVPVVIREMNEREASELALIENLQREDLNPMEEAVGYQTLMDSYGLTQEEAARVVNKSRPAVANALRLLNLSPQLRAFVEEGKLSAGHARALLPLSPTLQEQAANTVIQSDLSVRQTEMLAKRLQNGEKEPKTPAVPMVDYVAEAERSLSDSLGRACHIAHGKKKGRIEITYYGVDDLNALLDALATLDTKKKDREVL